MEVKTKEVQQEKNSRMKNSNVNSFQCPAYIEIIHLVFTVSVGTLFSIC